MQEISTAHFKYLLLTFIFVFKLLSVSILPFIYFNEVLLLRVKIKLCQFVFLVKTF